jgi:hypothetical protein
MLNDNPQHVMVVAKVASEHFLPASRKHGTVSL